MGWLFFLLWFLAGVPLFMRAYRQRLDVLEGPWIFKEIVQDGSGG
jgi:hypothetical protein